MFFEGIHHVNMFFGTNEDRPPLRFACRVRRANASSRSQSQEGVAALGSQGWHSPEAREAAEKVGKVGSLGPKLGPMEVVERTAVQLGWARGLTQSPTVSHLSVRRTRGVAFEFPLGC